jgi:type II secretory ATPase GspE/PulE/Tfp pilus assembly ATPase PilB-like protein/predicted Ser/Thr protein kinase
MVSTCVRCGREFECDDPAGAQLCGACGTERNSIARAATVELRRPGGRDGSGSDSTRPIELAPPTPPVLLEDRTDRLLGGVYLACRLIERIGEGGMGTVYKAHHLVLDKPVAVKALHERFSAQKDYVELFIREARSAARLEHPNIVQILNAGSEQGRYFIVMQYIDGKDLASRLQNATRLDVGEALRIAEDVARALAVAHEMGIVHRDIKPGNVMITASGGVKVADFGLAKELFRPSRPETDERTLGTPPYMSPEQFAGKAVDARTDLYSLGVMLYEMIVGSLPFEAEDAQALMDMHRSWEPPPISALLPGVPPGVDAIVKKLLEKRPERRHQSARDVIVDIRTLRRWIEEARVQGSEAPDGSQIEGSTRALADILQHAAEAGATDIHIEPEAEAWKVRLRIEGRLRPVRKLSPAEGVSLVSAAAAMAGLAVDGHDGRDGTLTFERRGSERRAIVSVMQSQYGRRAVLRLLDPPREPHRLEHFLLPQHIESARAWIWRGHGLILTGGPASSGKATSMWALVNEIDLVGSNAIAIEEEIHYAYEGVTRVRVSDRASRLEAIRDALRQDPDVLVVDDTSDPDVAATLVRAAVAGKLCLSCPHVATTTLAIFRLLEAGIDRSLLADGLTAAMSQRLVHVNCPHCREEYQPLPEVLESFKVPAERRGARFVKGRGCERCAGTGVAGRTVIYELFEPPRAFWDDIDGVYSETELRAAAKEHGLFTIRACALERIVQGDLTFREVMRTGVELD